MRSTAAAKERFARPTHRFCVSVNIQILMRHLDRPKIVGRVTRGLRDVSCCLCGRPTTNSGMQNGSSVGLRTRCIHVLAQLAPIFMLSRCLLTKFLARSSVESLLRVRCLVGQTFEISPAGVQNARCVLVGSRSLHQSGEEKKKKTGLTPSNTE